MALIKCSECGKEISDKIENCIHCGFPIKKEKNIDINILRKSNIKKINRWLFEATQNQNLSIRQSFFAIGDIVELKNENQESLGNFKLDTYCFLDINSGTYTFGFDKLTESIAREASIISKKIEDNIIINNIKCPNCLSTNITKITTEEKIMNTAMFGLFGNKRKMQFQCRNCKYMW